MAFNVDDATVVILLLALIIAVVARCVISNLRSLQNNRVKYPSIRERSWWLVDLQMLLTCEMAIMILLFMGWGSDDKAWAFLNNISADLVGWATILNLATHALVRQFALRGRQVFSLAGIIGFAVLIPLVAKTTIYKPEHSYISPDGVIGYAAPSALCFAWLLFSYRSDAIRIGTMKFETLLYAIMAVIASVWFYWVASTPETAWQGKLPLSLYILGSVVLSYGTPAYIANKASQKASASDNPHQVLIDPENQFPQGIASVVPRELTVSVVVRTMVELGRRGNLQQSFTEGLYLVSMMLSRNPGYFSENDLVHIPRVVVDAFSHQTDVISTPPTLEGTNYMAQIHHFLNDLAPTMIQRASVMGQGDDSPVEQAPMVIDAGPAIIEEQEEDQIEMQDADVPAGSG